ncbi:hypothetical protein [Geofilum rubicundum]|uniref:Outer membrane protein beta-barrel domain-containing protein n=1 Tax=Geofilum rubicundum JCM 15548 TaxID=1236989 RepID=A0A0E9LXM3_9BACT|nr:hypothetical protein [Geofilum rubicundum]GAO30048.1 hypothetical protein JCM15548_12292 [Geofilum rubicundum JCM 15548]
MRSIYFLAFWAMGLLTVSAQTDFRPGFIITHSMDTIHGLLDYRGEIRNMRICTFKNSPEEPSKEFLPGDIYGYRFNAGKYYVSKEVDTEALKETVFVEFLLKGISNLYYYNSLNYRAYFLESEDSGLLELRKNEIEIEKNGKIFTGEDNRYLGILSYAFSDCPEIRKDVFQTGLTHKSLIDITHKYHDYKCSDEVCVIYEKKLPVLRIEWKPTIGYAINGIAFNNSEYEQINSDIEQVDFRMSSSPLAGLGINFIVPRWNEKLTFLVNVSFNKDYFYGTQFQRHPGYAINSYYHINNDNLLSSFSLKYTYPKYKFRPEVFAGVYGQSILNSHIRFYLERAFLNSVYTSEENPELFKKFSGGITGGLGLEYVLLNKFRAFSNFSILYGMSLNTYEMETVFTSFRLSTGLTF